MRLRSIVLIACLGVALAPTSASAQTTDVLPDLDQMVPSGLVVKAHGSGKRRTYRLGFNSAAANVGAGPLTLHGYRRTRLTPLMRVDQLVQQSDGSSRLIRDVGVMSYIIHPTHRHWHLLGFERYELRSGDGDTSLRLDHKTGFCLGDRFPLPHATTLGAFTPVPLQGDTCGLGRPGLKGLFAGISVGWADMYTANLEGQYINVTGVPSGTYVLVHRLNTERRLLESDLTNDASSVRFRLTWPRRGKGAARVRILRRCPATAACPRARRSAH